MNFSEVLEYIKAGARAYRTGWNGKGMFVYFVQGSTFEVNRPPLLQHFDDGTVITYKPHIDISHPDGSCSVWQPSMGDVLADDWELIK